MKNLDETLVSLRLISMGLLEETIAEIEAEKKSMFSRTTRTICKTPLKLKKVGSIAHLLEPQRLNAHV